MTENFLTPLQVSLRLSVHIGTVRRWIRDGELIAISLRGWKIREADLNTFLEKRSNKAA